MTDEIIDVKHGNAVRVKVYRHKESYVWLDVHLRDEDTVEFVAMSRKQARKLAKALKRASRKPIKAGKGRL